MPPKATTSRSTAAPAASPAVGGSASSAANSGHTSSSADNAPAVQHPPGPDVHVHDYTSQDVANSLATSVPALSSIVDAWAQSAINGASLLTSTPSRFRALLEREISDLPDPAKFEIFNHIRGLIFAQAARDSASVDTDTLSLWKASIQGESLHGGGGNIQQTLPASNQSHTLPPPPAFFMQQQRFTPQPKPTKFAFGALEHQSPISLFSVHGTPSQTNWPAGLGVVMSPNPLQLPSPSSNASLQVAAPTQHHLNLVASSQGSAVSSNQQNQDPFAQSQHQNPLGLPFGNPLVSSNQDLPSGQQGVPPSLHIGASNPHQFSALHANLNQHNPGIFQQQQQHHVPQVGQLPMFNQVHGRPLFPWEEEAVKRPLPVQDPDMMPGFSRTNIGMIIEAAKAKRLALGPDAGKNMIHVKVTWPEMTAFTVEEWLRCRPLFGSCVKASFSSCLFKEFKDCMTDTCRRDCRRIFLLNELNWLALDDFKLQFWLSIHFGPVSKEDAIRRLTNVKFPDHSDAYDSQSTFVNKLTICAYEFELAINDIADTHRKWIVDRSKLSNGALQIKEVMAIWRLKFPKQEHTVFSVQLKECRDFMEREKDLLFDDIIGMLCNHFTQFDNTVKTGKVHYSTQPTKTRHITAPIHATTRDASSVVPAGRERFSPEKRPRPDSSSRHATAGGGGGGGGGGFNKSSAKPAPRPERKVVPGHMRGISCGSVTSHFGLGCSASTCPVWGTKHDKNKNGHVWKDSNIENTVVIEKSEYDALLKAKPGILLKWAAAKEQFLKARHTARVSALSSGQSVSSDEDDSDDDARRDEFNELVEQQPLSDTDDATVNDEECVVSALDDMLAPMSSKHVLSQNRMNQFYGVSRVIDHDTTASLIKTLMDPGANYNIVSPAVSDICAIQSLDVRVELFQGKKKQCAVDELVQCRFELQTSKGDFVKYVEWCLCADLGYDLLLGRKFNHDNGFTNFSALNEWKKPSEMSHPAPPLALAAAIDVNIVPNPQFVFLKFSRNDAALHSPNINRKDKSLRCDLPLLSPTNLISHLVFSTENPAAEIKIINSKVVAGVKEVQLQFRIESDDISASSSVFIDWFVVSKDIPVDCVRICMPCPASATILQHGKRRSRLASIAEGSHIFEDRNTDVHNSVPFAAASKRNRDMRLQKSKEDNHRWVSGFLRQQPFIPLETSTGQIITRLTRNGMRGRTAMTARIDNFAPHNIIDKSLLADSSSDSAIKQLDRKTTPDLTLVLLEFSINCADKSDSQLRLREWFRVIDCPPDSCNIVIRGLFDKTRLRGIDQSFAVQPRSAPSARMPVRDNAPSKQRFEDDIFMSRDEIDTRVAQNAAFVANANARSRDGHFISYHPVSHHRLARATKPPLKPCDHTHASYLGNTSQRERRKEMVSAINDALLFKEASRSQHILREMLKQLPADAKAKEQADVAELLKSSSMQNFESALDDDAIRQQTAHAANASADSAVPNALQSDWTPAAGFAPGVYVEIRNALTATELNGKRVRLYQQTDIPCVWLIRVLGKNQGMWKCHEKFLQPLPDHAQGRARPAGPEAGFLDVAIDETGQPTGDVPSIAHRQFGAEYSKELTKRIESLKGRFPHVFTKDVSEPCGFEKMSIKLIPNAILPGKSRWYRNTPLMKEEVRRQIQEQLDWGAVRRSATPHCSDILLVKRPHMPGQWRFVINFQKLNDATVPEQLIMPDPASQHARLAGCKIFGALDLSSYFRQLELDEASQYLTGFASDEGTFVHTRVPMGIRNAPSFAQRVLQDALSLDPILGPLGIKNYFDDVPFGAKTEDEFLCTMEAMLVFCEKWKLKVNPDKSIFGVTSITHVGFVVSEAGVSIDPERSRDIAELQAPKSIKKVQSVLGVLNYVRNFIPDFSNKAKHLTDKLAAAPSTNKHPASAKQPAPAFVWTEADQEQFEQLKACVLAAPLLAQLDYSKEIYVRCDASRFGAGAVLFQYDDQGRECVACYASRKFLPAETRWSTFQQEASTVVWALERFREFTQGYHVIVECDHRNISFVKRSAMPQLARWRMRLQDHDFTIRFLSGALNLVADGLSRGHVDDVEVTLADAMPECSLLYAKPSSTVDFASVSALETTMYHASDQSQPAFVDANEAHGTSSSSESDSDDASAISSSDDETAETVPRFGPLGQLLDPDGNEQLAPEDQPAHINAPFLNVETELDAVHNDLVGHKGVYVTLQRLLRNGRSWGSKKQMLDDVDAFIRGCPVCQKMKKRRERVLVDRHVISGSPFSELSIDVLKLPYPDVRGNKYCIVIIDNFSHWLSLTACVNKSAFEAARALLQFIGNFGAPLRLRSDGGKEFVNGVITGLTRMMGISPMVVQPYTPTANGIVERANRALLERARELCMCQRLVKHTAHQWGDLLPIIQRNLNASFHSAIGTSPSRILFGDCVDLDRALLTQIPAGCKFDKDKYCDALAINQRVIMEEADRLQTALCSRLIAKTKAKQPNVAPPAFAVNDWVLLKPQPKFPLHKLAPRWPGPFRIHRISETSDKVTLVDTVADKLFTALKRQLEHFNISRVSDVSGLTKVAEADNFEFPVECIMGHALLTDAGVGVNAIQLRQDFMRGVRPKRCFQFLIKWTGYEEPTWVAYKDAKKLVQFPGYVTVFPNLNLL